MTTSTATQASDEEMPAITIDAAPRYLDGFPMLLALTYENHSRDSEFYHLPTLGLIETKGDLSLRLEPLRGGVRVETRFPALEEPEGITLLPGQASQHIVDLSNLGIRFRPGAYRLILTLIRGKWIRSSNAAEIEIATPSASDAAEGARLRRLGEAPLDTGAWARFLYSNWHTVTVSPSLSTEAKQQLALHLFLHRAVYGPETVAALDPAPLAAIAEPSLLGEVALLRYELLVARHDPSVKTVRAVMLKTYPGLTARADAVDNSEGEIAVLRRSIGAEKQHLRSPATRPYVP